MKVYDPGLNGISVHNEMHLIQSTLAQQTFISSNYQVIKGALFPSLRALGGPERANDAVSVALEPLCLIYCLLRPPLTHPRLINQ